ncbi:alpha/beta hydrolase [Rhodococcus sp. NPDC057297]|uniref:alpha/beta hydrolase n=1 Tax=Rhodococcus sp. NPDC057297 TaxID=3346090 RepID=UPI003640B4F2
MKVIRPALILAASGTVIAGCSASSTPDTDAHPPPASAAYDWTTHNEPITWSACPDNFDSTGLQCATVPVPLDYDDPDGERIDLTISKLASTNPDERRGSLMLNPGGPGGTGLDQPKFLVERGIPQETLDSYDLIGIDTRGVGHSSPINCGITDDIQYRGAVPPYAYDDSAFDEQNTVARRVAENCAEGDDGRMKHVTTANMARDLDSIRQALGDEKGNFLGYSYGSALGGAYASLFPDKTDRIVLDSNIGDTHLDRDGMRSYSEGMEDTFPDFANWAAERNEQYRLGSTPEEVRQTYFTIADKLDREPVEGLDGRSFRLGMFVALYNPASYDATAQMWRTALDTLPSEGPPVGQGASAFDNTWSVFLAVTCNDVEWPRDPEVYKQAIEEDREKNPLFGAAAANIMPCAYWQLEHTEPPVPVEADGPTNILVAQHQRDPVTPFSNGERINEMFGDRSRLLTADGSGHGVYALGQNQCAQDVITDYLVDGVMPNDDVSC